MAIAQVTYLAGENEETKFDLKVESDFCWEDVINEIQKVVAKEKK